ncbi:MAG: hypothetical protein ACTHN5_21385 [Phycisphaerae bacterium]
MDSKAMLSSATKELFARWEDVKNIWSDAQSKAFEETYIRMIENDVRSAMSALDSMNQVLLRIESDCE